MKDKNKKIKKYLKEKNLPSSFNFVLERALKNLNIKTIRPKNGNRKWKKLRKKADGTDCPYCGISMKYYEGICISHSEHPDATTIEHIIDLRYGGEDVEANVIACCSLCNDAFNTLNTMKGELNDTDVIDIIIWKILYANPDTRELAGKLLPTYQNQYEKRRNDRRNNGPSSGNSRRGSNLLVSIKWVCYQFRFTRRCKVQLGLQSVQHSSANL